MKVNKDLGVSSKEYLNSPEMAGSDRTHYPTFHYVGSEELGLPKEGTMTVKFKEVSSTHSDRDGKKNYECTVELREIVSVTGDVKAPAKSGSEAGDALDKLAHEKSESKKKEAAEQSGEDDKDEY